MQMILSDCVFCELSFDSVSLLALAFIELLYNLRNEVQQIQSLMCFVTLLPTLLEFFVPNKNTLKCGIK